MCVCSKCLDNDTGVHCNLRYNTERRAHTAPQSHCHNLFSPGNPFERVLERFNHVEICYDTNTCWWGCYMRGDQCFLIRAEESLCVCVCVCGMFTCIHKIFINIKNTLSDRCLFAAVRHTLAAGCIFADAAVAGLRVRLARLRAVRLVRRTLHRRCLRKIAAGLRLNVPIIHFHINDAHKFNLCRQLLNFLL